MEQEIKNTRCVMLSADTAELLDCKKALDEIYGKVGGVAARIFGENSLYDESLNEAYALANSAIMDLLTQQIDHNSTESHYKVI